TYSPAADSLEAVREAVDAISVAGGAGFAGTGPHQITVTVTAVGVPVPGVAIRFDQGGITTGGTLYTNGAGVAGPFALAAGPHTLLAAKSGYAGHAEALTIAGNANLPVAIATSGVQAPPDVEHTTGVLVTRDGMGLLQPNTAVNFRLVATTVDDQQTPQAGRSFGRVFVGTSDADALLQVPLLKSARYEAWRGKGKVVAFTTGTEDSFLVPEVLAGTNDGQTV
ncbi:MAG TPA: hypothetical protein VK324_09065, partial [Tepidisphaeraceae bacterium]|nr:hypothetical protein [Tepidisphaeraceae bacterium]